MLTCRELTEQATRFLEGDLGWAEWVQLRMHILLCPPCRDYLEQVEVTVEALHRVPSEPLPQEVSDELMRRFRDWVASRGADGPRSGDAPCVGPAERADEARRGSEPPEDGGGGSSVDEAGSVDEPADEPPTRGSDRGA